MDKIVPPEEDKTSEHSSESEVEPEFIPTFHEAIINLKYDKKKNVLTEKQSI